MARDFFWFYFSSIFRQKKPGATLLVAGENPRPPALDDNPGEDELLGPLNP